jgi:ribosomal protein S18 acetylase RimI-like enzyme
MNIRKMSIDDYKGAYQIWTSTEGVGLRSLDDSHNGIKKFIDRNPNTNFVAVDGDKIVGVILSGHDGRRAYIYHTCVNTEYRGQGIGKMLVDAALDALKAEGINKAALVVFTDNQIGNPFWSAIGWERRLDLNYYNKSLNGKNV